MGAWNVLSQREDDHLSLLSSELQHFNIGIAALSEVQRPDSGEIMVGDPPLVSRFLEKLMSRKN